MAGQQPTFKLEGMPDNHVKMEPIDDTPSPYMDDDQFEDDDDNEEELDMKQAQQDMWLGHIPRTLWETLSQLNNDDEIHIGTIRVEGPPENPKRVSMLLNRNLPQFSEQHKEYNLFPAPPEKRKARRLGQALIFSEKDKPGYKSKSFHWDNVDEDGNPGQGRSFLYEKHKKEVKRKESKSRFTPYVRKPIPKLTSIAGTISKEFEITPVKNEEYQRVEDIKSARLLKAPEKTTIEITAAEPTRSTASYMTARERAEITKSAQAKKQAAKDNRVARMEKSALIDALLEAFREHRFWGLRDLKHKVQQPESYLRETLDEIATMWKHGDFNGKWELKDEYKAQDPALLNSMGAAPKAEDSDADKSGFDDDDDEAFEDV